MAISLALPAGAQAAFPGENGDVAFSGRYLSGGVSHHITSADPDGSGIASLTGTTAGELEANPSWSADGERIAFERGNSTTEIWTMAADGSEQRRLTSGFGDHSPSFTPDGSQVVFLRFESVIVNGESMTNEDLMTVDVATGQIRNLTNTPQVPKSDPSVSPDGTRVAFSMFNDSQWNLATVPIGGGSATLLVGGGGGLGPDYSPDGTRIAFTRCVAETQGGEGCRFRILTVPASGGAAAPLTTDSTFAGDVVEVAPAYSPDGSQLVFATTDPRFLTQPSLATIGAGGGSVQTRFPAGTSQPTWQPVHPRAPVDPAGPGGPSPPAGQAARCKGAAVTILGTTGPDTLKGTVGPDVIQGLGGRDKIKAGGGDDLVCGSNGPDRLLGGSGDDELVGGAGPDYLNGGEGKNRLIGGTPGGRAELRRVVNTCVKSAGDTIQNCQVVK